MASPIHTDRRTLMQAAVAAGTLGAARAEAAPAGPPNILFILADDLGWADLSCYGRRDYQTPNLDRLAAQGALLTQGYANSAVCSATRTALITGRYQYRLPVGLEEPIAGPTVKVGLPPPHPTLPSLLKARGYRTALVGKWHLGFAPSFGPMKSGYDSFFGFYPGSTDYFRRRAVTNPDPAEIAPALYDGDREVDPPGYLTDLLADRAIQEIGRTPAGQPFFISLHFNAPHWPWEGPDDEAVARRLKELRHYNGGDQRVYAAMVRSLDANIGRVLAALKARGLERNTLVVFTSDNGGERFSDVWPFVGMKGELLEGGIRVPLLVRWPARIRPRRLAEQVMISMDWLPTLLAAAGGAPDPAYPSDGENLLPVLTGEVPRVPRKLYWRYKASEQAAVRDENWKYLRIAGREHLFDVLDDERERADLKDDRPDIFNRLRADYAAWNAAMLPYPEGSYSETPKGRLVDRY